MALPSRDDLLQQVDAQFRVRVPDAPHRLDPNDPDHTAMIEQWWAVHRETLDAMTDDAFAAVFPDAPKRLDPSDPAQAAYVAYWRDMAHQIEAGEPGRWDWSNPPTAVTGVDPDLIEIEGEEEQPEPVPQDGSVRLEDRIDYLRLLLEEFARPVIQTDLGFKAIQHTTAQIEVLRGLVRDGTFTTYDHWWRSASFSDAVWDTDDPQKQLAFVRDLTVEAKIDRNDGSLDTYLAGWSSNLMTGESFGRVSRAGA